ncbi:cadherin-like beta sandwich domain-containing protein [Brevibacillus reuszeri]|uniref:cadherin-like beta sandwich domain-containing protein n=1 Tax=Brevibacillus reuszeri TaxID=54915 RepID=UPI000CCC524A|nr:cadherin-like beta sandwich domain-containing protein [Brevibacillus reuszeri]
MELNLLFRKIQRMMRFSLGILLVAVSLGMGLGVQSAMAATWNTVNHDFSASFMNKIAYGNGTWLLFSQSGDFGKSTDGTTFERHSSKTAFPCEVNKAMHVGTQWIAGCSNGKVYTLADGLDPVDVTKWVEQTTGKSGKLVSIATDGDTIVVVGDSGGTLLTSVDGHNWVDRSIRSAAGFNDVTYGQGKFLAVGRASDNRSAIYASDDGETWNKVNTATPGKQLYGIAYNGAKFVAVGLEGYLYVSDDGESWVEKTPPAGTQSISFATVSYGAGQFYVGGTSQTILTSPDGSTFTTEISRGSAQSVTSIAVANGKAIAAGSSGLLLSAAAVPPISSNASLSNLTVTPGSLTFNPATPNYTVEVPYDTTSVTVTPTLQDITATLTVNGTSQANGEATSVMLDADGSTDISIVVTAQDGITTKTYIITVNKQAPASNGYLSSLSVNDSLVSGFVKTNYSYSVEVPYGTDDIHVSWIPDERSTLQELRVNGTSLQLGSPPISGISFPLNLGEVRVIEIRVKAQDGTSTKYTLMVKRVLSNNANLSDLQVNPGVLTFKSDTTEYTVEVPFGTTSVTITPTLQDITATMKLNGTSRVNGAAVTVTLDADGSTEIPIVVTAQDGVTTKTYSITVNEEAPASNGYLSSLSVDGTPVSGFVKTDYSYSVEVPHGTGSINVNWLLDEPSTQILQAVKIDSVSQPLGPITGLPLTPDVARVIEIHVKAQNGTITVYTLTVTVTAALVNKTDLHAKVTEINNKHLLEADYTPASWNDLQNALTAAQTVLNNLSATQIQVDDALAALNAAHGGLENVVAPVDKSELQAKVTAITAENLKSTAYTATSWQVFQTALTLANDVLSNASATQADISNALTELTNARKGLIRVNIPVVVDKSVLQSTLAKINAENLEEATYKPESWESLQDAWTQANKVMADSSATQVEVDRAASALIAARDGLIEQGIEVDKSKLQAKVNEIINENLLEEDYTKASWDTLQEALREANDVLDDPNATQDEAYAELAALTKARQGLKKQADSTVDKSKLDEKVDEIKDEDLHEADYTKSSWRALEKALREADEVLADPHATQGEVDEVLAALKKARKALEKAEREKDRDRDRDRDRDKDKNENNNDRENSTLGSGTGTPEAGDEKNDQKGYMNGYTSGNFEPDRSVTRAELAMILVNTGMVKPVTSVNGYFFDVAENYWAADAIKRANEAGLMNGYANGMFNPTDGVTREEMAVILFRYRGLRDDGMNNSFSDVAGDHWSAQMIAAVSKEGLVSGYPDGRFLPEKELTRAELVTILNRLLTEEQLNHVSGQTWPDVPPTHWAFKDIEAASKK